MNESLCAAALKSPKHAEEFMQTNMLLKQGDRLTAAELMLNRFEKHDERNMHKHMQDMIHL